MPTFGIVAEGITDQVVIENILLGYFEEDQDEPVINRLQPLVDRTGKKSISGPGGWELLFKFFQVGDHLGALQNNNYLIVQVDTDRCEDKGYDVPRREGGAELTALDLLERVRAKIVGLIGPEVFARHGHRFIFAIAVNDLECWLLPLLYTTKQAAKVTGCLKAANHVLNDQQKDPLSRGKDSKEKVPRVYETVSAAYCKRRTLMKEGPRNPSLAVFLKNLAAVRAAGAPAGAERVGGEKDEPPTALPVVSKDEE